MFKTFVASAIYRESLYLSLRTPCIEECEVTIYCGSVPQRDAQEKRRQEQTIEMASL